MIQNDVIYGKNLKDWDKEWVHKGLLNEANIIQLKGKIGLYKIYYGSNNSYIGKGSELNNKGLYKRLNDYIRKNKSGRETETGEEIHKDLGNAKFDILVVGKDIEAVIATAYLELYYINKEKPIGNKHGKTISE